MHQEPIQVLQAAQRPAGVSRPRKPDLLIAGATGALGSEVLRRLAGSLAFAHTQVLAREPITAGLRGVATLTVAATEPADWPPATAAGGAGVAADIAVVLFDPPRLFYDRERALWTPTPGQLPALARWLRAAGVHTLAVVLPHDQGRLPEALKRGLANLDEHAVASIGFERLLIVRAARKPQPVRTLSLPQRIARFMLSVFQHMVPSSEQPVRAAAVAQVLALALEHAPPGLHVAAPDLVWQAAQGDARAAVRGWLGA